MKEFGKVQKLPSSILNALPQKEREFFERYKFIPLEMLIPASWNEKSNDLERTEQFSIYLKTNDAVPFCQVRKLSTGFYEILDGNYKLFALRQLGYKCVIAFDHGKIPFSKAKMISSEKKHNTNANPNKLVDLFIDLALDFPDFDLLKKLKTNRG
ncbi:hypothetical protein D9V84_10370 [Bacteroidetes/Chlorobi group bacterium Naka2016]|jgi:hypothetical protein|nr:MAG: hypothetical protein D9V84_10370 [Bacteroidetes/Chlorobi group bacterium Naka2016]